MVFKELMTEELAREVLLSVTRQREAELFQNKSNTPSSVQKIVIPLTTARDAADPYKISIPFRSFWVQDATDTNVSVNIKLLTRDSSADSFTVKKNDVYGHDEMCSEVYLDWAAQSGKTLTIVFFTRGVFSSGSQISVTGGGVFLSEGTSFVQSVQTLAAATAAIVFPVDSTRALGFFQNNTGASVYVGPSTVAASGANLGEEVPAGTNYYWRNTAALYAISTPGGDLLKRIQN